MIGRPEAALKVKCPYPWDPDGTQEGLANLLWALLLGPVVAV